MQWKTACTPQKQPPASTADWDADASPAPGKNQPSGAPRVRGVWLAGRLRHGAQGLRIHFSGWF
ncbi:hypothetical protein [Polaromonas sp. CG9_12]|nr:hypothetical protein [Polaromonas sp. CG9_12]